MSTKDVQHIKRAVYGVWVAGIRKTFELYSEWRISAGRVDWYKWSFLRYVHTWTPPCLITPSAKMINSFVPLLHAYFDRIISHYTEYLCIPLLDAASHMSRIFYSMSRCAIKLIFHGSEFLARMSWGCYEETGPVQFQLNAVFYDVVIITFICSFATPIGCVNTDEQKRKKTLQCPLILAQK